MKKITYLLSALCSCCFLQAQVYVTTENKLLDGGSDFFSSVHMIAPLANGGYMLLAGTTYPKGGTVRLPGYGKMDGVLMHIGQDHKPVWQKIFGGADVDRPAALLVGPDAFYAGFNSASPSSGNKQPACYDTGTVRSDFWIVKTDTEGNILWQNVYGTTRPETLVSMTALPDNRILLAGTSAAKAELDKSEDSYSNDIWLLCIDENGNRLWDKTVQRQTDDKAVKAVACEDGVIIGGIFVSTPFPDPKDPPYNPDIGILKLDLSGNIVWESKLGGKYYEELLNLQVHGEHIFLSAAFDAALLSNKHVIYEYGRITHNPESRGALFAVMDMDGNVLQERRFDGDSQDLGYYVFPSLNGGYLLLMSSASDITDVGGFQDDLWIIYADRNMQTLAQYVAGGTQNDEINGIIYHADGSLSCVLRSISGIGADRSLEGSGKPDLWLFKLKNELFSLEPFPESVLEVYPNPSTGQITIVLSKHPEAVRVRIFSAGGICVYENDSFSWSQNLLNIDINSYPRGMYIVELQSIHGTVHRQKVIKH